MLSIIIIAKFWPWCGFAFLPLKFIFNEKKDCVIDSTFWKIRPPKSPLHHHEKREFFWRIKKNFNCWKTELNHVPRQPNFGSDRLTKNNNFTFFAPISHILINERFGILATLYNYRLNFFFYACVPFSYLFA